MSWFKRIFGKTQQEEWKPSLDENGGYLKATEFESIWISENVYDSYGCSKTLKDDDYIDYLMWVDMNSDKMFKKHLPDTLVIRGKNPNIIFHGGCLGCISQRNHGIDRCKGCQYFKANWYKPNLFIKGEKSATIDSQEDFDDLFKL